MNILKLIGNILLYVFNMCCNRPGDVSEAFFSSKQNTHLPLGSVWLDQVGFHRETVDAH